MSGSRSNDKGDRYEREIAKTLSAWSGVELCRTPRGAPEEMYADIWPVMVTDHFPLAVECKCQEEWNFDQIMRGTGPWFGWLAQACDQSTLAQQRLGRLHVPMLVFSRNRFPDWVAVPARFGLRGDSLLGRMQMRVLCVSNESELYEIHELERYLSIVQYTRFVRDAQRYRVD